MSGHHDSHVEALAEHVAQTGWIKFREMNEFLESRGVSTTVGNAELTGGHVMQPHISPRTTLFGPTSQEYVDTVEALFGSYPLVLVFGDVADFDDDEPWWVIWVGDRYRLRDVGHGKHLAVFRDNEIEDRAKHAFAVGSEIMAEMQYRLAELAGLGRLDADESTNLQKALVHLYEVLYAGTVSAVRDSTATDFIWSDFDNSYADGRQVLNQIHIESEEEARETWGHGRFLLCDGAPKEFPLGTISYIAPIRPEESPGWERNRSPESSLRDRLERHREPGPSNDGGTE